MHHAELSRAEIVREFDESGEMTETVEELIEITSSGLTHSCEDTLITSLLCPQMLKTFDHHRSHPTNASYYIGQNYGNIELVTDTSSGVIGLKVSVHSLDVDSSADSAVLSHVIPFQRAGAARAEAAASLASGGKGSMVHIRYARFPSLSESLSADVLADVILVTGFILALIVLGLWWLCGKLWKLSAVSPVSAAKFQKHRPIEKDTKVD